MIVRQLSEAHNDYQVLSKSLEEDEFHVGMTPMFFVEPDTVTTVYEDDKGPVLYARGKVIGHNQDIVQLDLQFVNNKDLKRNMRIMLQGFPELEERAKANGFTAFVFDSTNPPLIAFCQKRLGFFLYKVADKEYLVKIINENNY